MKLFKFLLLLAFLVYHPILSSSLPTLRHISEFLFTSCLLLRHPYRPLQASIISRFITELGKRRAIISHFPRVFQIE
jgi:hypothetical protein